jgi:hypothetical protein
MLTQAHSVQQTLLEKAKSLLKDIDTECKMFIGVDEEYRQECLDNAKRGYIMVIAELYNLVVPQSNAKVIMDFEILPPPNKSVVDLAEEFVFDRMD